MDLPYHFGMLRMSTFCYFNWFSKKANIIYIICTNVSVLLLLELFHFCKNHVFMKKISLYKIMSPRGIFWTILTYFTILEFLECLLFGNLNDFSLKITEFTWYSQMQAYFFCKLFFTKIVFSQKNIFYIIMPTAKFFWTILTCFTILECWICLL